MHRLMRLLYKPKSDAIFRNSNLAEAPKMHDAIFFLTIEDASGWLEYHIDLSVFFVGR
jgi:hypothetical protein